MKVSIVKPLAKFLNNESQMAAKLGRRAEPLMLRLAVLRATPTLADVPRGPPERCHELTKNRKGQFAMSIGDQWRLIVVPDHDPVPLKPDGGIDTKAVTDILVTEVSDHYE